MRKRPTIKEWADKLGIDMNVANAYIRVRNNWIKNVNKQAKKLGITPIKTRPEAFTAWAKNPFLSTEEAMIRATEKWRQRSANFERYTTDKAKTFISNIILAQNSTGNPDDDHLMAKAWKKLNKLSDTDYLILSDRIANVLKDKDVIYVKEGGEVKLNFDFSEVYEIIKNYKAR